MKIKELFIRLGKVAIGISIMGIAGYYVYNALKYEIIDGKLISYNIQERPLSLIYYLGGYTLAIIVGVKIIISAIPVENDQI